MTKTKQTETNGNGAVRIVAHPAGQDDGVYHEATHPLRGCHTAERR